MAPRRALHLGYAVALVLLAAGAQAAAAAVGGGAAALGVAQPLELVTPTPELLQQAAQQGQAAAAQAGSALAGGMPAAQGLQEALDSVHQVEEELWGIMDGVAGIFLTDPAGADASAAARRRLQQAGGGGSTAPPTLDSVVAQMQSLAQHLLVAEAREALHSTANAYRAAVGLPATAAPAGATPAALSVANATDAFSAVLLGSIADSFNSSLTTPTQRALGLLGSGSNAAGAGGGSISGALSSGVQLFSTALNSMNSVAATLNSTLSQVGSAANPAPGASAAAQPANAFFSSFLTSFTNAAAGAASPAPTPPPGPAATAATVATPVSSLFPSFFSGARSSAPGAAPTAPSSTTPGSAASFMQALAGPALQSASSAWQQQVQSVLSAVTQHSADFSSLLGGSGGAGPAASGARRRLLQLASASDLPGRYHELKEQWLHGGKPLLAASRGLLQSLPAEPDSGFYTQVLVQGADAVSAGQHMVDGLLGLLRDTIHLTLQAALAEQGNVVLVEPMLALETDPNMEISNNAAAGSAAPSSAGSTSAGAGAGPQVAGFGFSGTGGDYYGWDLGWGGSDGGEGGEGGFVPPPPSEAAWEALMSGGAQQLGAAVRRRLQATEPESVYASTEYSYHEEYAEERWLDEYAWMLGQAQQPEPAVLGFVATGPSSSAAPSGSSDPAAVPDALLEWLSQLALMLSESIDGALAADGTAVAGSGASAGSATGAIPPLPSFAVFGARAGHLAGTNTTNAAAGEAEGSAPGLVAAVVVPLSGAARLPPQRSAQPLPGRFDIKWWGLTVSLACVGLLLGAVAVLVVRRSSSSRLDREVSYNHIPGVPPPGVPPPPRQQATAAAPAAAGGKGWEEAVQHKALAAAKQQGTVAKKLSNLPA